MINQHGINIFLVEVWLTKVPPSLLAHIYSVFFLDAFYIGLRYRSGIFQYKTTDASRQPERPETRRMGSHELEWDDTGGESVETE